MTLCSETDELSELKEVFEKDNAYNNKFPIISGIKRQYKETEGWLQAMCETMERIREDGRAEAAFLINKLHGILLKSKQFDDLKHLTLEPQYQEQLIEELLCLNH